ncbi:glycosyltransferase family 2 protein [Geothrix sp. SG200]|uniref:glycosyltransferase family 2 protein n=1 Tax=Geothrix sp. SG200 TaxID=2922865 RepID=UPI001FAC6BBC|nr:glycosyltransferase family 2 protein [Geothrix sp. SG200]
MNQAGRVSVVIVNYNGEAFIGDCLNSLLGDENVCEIIVVDNASKDGSLEYLGRRFPDVTLLQSTGNIGFGRACNLGAEKAKGEFLLLLNYDAELGSRLEGAINYLDAHPETGMLGGRITYPDGRMQPSIGRSMVPIRLACSWLSLSRWFPRNSWLSQEILDVDWYLTAHKSVDWVTGALMLIRRTSWERVGGMDPAFFLYVEDVDLCERLKASGASLDYSPVFSARHRKGGGAEIVSPRALMSSIDSYDTYLSKHHGHIVVSVTLASIGIIFSLRALAMALRLWRGDRSRAEARTYLMAARRAFRLSAGVKFPWGPPI